MLIQIKQIEGLGNALSSKFDVTGGTITGSVSATTYYGDGSNLTGISATPGGVHGNIQFNFGGSFGGENNLFWDVTNKRLGVGTDTPTSFLDVRGESTDDTFNSYTNFSGNTGFAGGLKPNVFEWEQNSDDDSTGISTAVLSIIGESNDGVNNITNLIGQHIDLYGGGSENVYGTKIDLLGGGMGTTNWPSNMYGLYIDDVWDGTNSNYSIYTNEGLVRFGELGTGASVNNLGIDTNGVLVVGESGGDSENISKEITQTGHSLTLGNAIYFDGTEYKKALSNDSETLGLFIVSNVIDVNTFELTIIGWIDGLSGFTSGEYYYVSDTTPGLLTSTQPLTSYSNPLFFADGTSSGYVLNMRPSISSSGSTGSTSTVSLKAEIENNIGVTFNNEVFTYDSSNKMTLIEYNEDATNIYTKNIYYNSSDTVTATTITKISDSSTLNTIFNYNSSGIITGKTYS